jgi:hypothetical protein
MYAWTFLTLYEEAYRQHVVVLHLEIRELLGIL